MTAATLDRGEGEVLVCCERVARSFGSGAAAVVAVHDVTCQVRAGERIAISGPSGSGKSTLLHLLAGLDQPTAGMVSWPALGDRAELLPRRVGVMFQGQSLLAALDVTENVALPLLLSGVPEAAATMAAQEALARLHLEELAAKLPEELSGGQAQRVAAARVLASRPRLILADEPTGQLDHATGAEVVRALLQAAEALDAALVVTTHDPLVAAALPQRWAMADGALSQAGEARSHQGRDEDQEAPSCSA
jgi:putative ABC transport system ATP-binding protein